MLDVMDCAGIIVMNRTVSLNVWSSQSGEGYRHKTKQLPQ